MRFSIIIPCYNVAPWIRACVESTAAAGGAKGSETEVICVDDGSTDGTGELLDEMARTRKLVVIHQENRGVAAARNRGLAAATGEWVCFLDGDDLLAPGMFASVERAIARNPEANVIVTGLRRFADGTDPYAPTPEAETTNCGTDGADELDLTLVHAYFCRGFYRRSAFGDVRFPDFQVGEDRVYAMQCVVRGIRPAQAGGIGYLYRQRATSVLHTEMSPRKAEDGFGHVAELLRTVRRGGRNLTQAQRRGLVAQILEEGARNVRRTNGRWRRDVREAWLKTIADLRRAGELTRWGDFVARMLATLPSALTAFVLCELPGKMKKWLKVRKTR